MFEEREISFSEAEELLSRCGLYPVDNADIRIGIFAPDGELAATGALVGNMLQMIAVDESFQGEDLAARVVSSLISRAISLSRRRVYLFTKSKNVPTFRGIGFRLVADVRDGAALLEWGRPGIDEYCAGLKKLNPGVNKTGCIVMNANPFTLGHRYLAEKAAAECEKVFILAVEENLSEFPFEARLAMLKAGTADLENITVIPGGRYVISSLTFPAYFSRDALRSRQQSQVDAAIFEKYIAPSLGVTDRYVGEEPFSESTCIYNEVLAETLKSCALHTVPRLELYGNAVSASRVRQLIKEGKREQAYNLLPKTTAEYIAKHEQEVDAWLRK